MVLGGVALVAASLVLTYSVVVRYFLQDPDRLAGRDRGLPARRRDLPVGASVQSQRGHVGIEAVAALCRRARTACGSSLVDVMSLALLRLLRLEVLDAAARGLGRRQRLAVDWAPPLWIPYR